MIFAEKTAHLCCAKGDHAPKFCRENFHG